MPNDIDKIKKLRQITGAGFKDCSAALQEGNENIEKAIEISWTKRKWSNLDSINKFYAILETISHLEFLRLNNKIQKDFKNERWEYALIKKDR